MRIIPTWRNRRNEQNWQIISLVARTDVYTMYYIYAIYSVNISSSERYYLSVQYISSIPPCKNYSHVSFLVGYGDFEGNRGLRLRLVSYTFIHLLDNCKEIEWKLWRICRWVLNSFGKYRRFHSFIKELGEFLFLSSWTLLEEER
jgi:hypothetical protein